MSSNYFEVLYIVSGTFIWYNMPLFLTKSLPQNPENPIFKPETPILGGTQGWEQHIANLSNSNKIFLNEHFMKNIY